MGGELREMVGEGPTDRLPVPAEQPEGPERTDLGIEDLGLNAIPVHGGQPGDGLAVARITERLHVPVIEGELFCPPVVRPPSRPCRAIASSKS